MNEPERVSSAPTAPETSKSEFGSGRRAQRLRDCAKFGATAIVGLDVVVLFGWMFGIAWLTSFNPLHASTSAATAICFILGGIAVYLQAQPLQRAWVDRLGSASAVLVLMIASYDLTTYIRGDALAGYLFGPHMGQMAPATAAGFVLLALAVLSGKLARGYAQSGLAAAGIMLALIDVVCHIFGASAIYTLLPFAAMALSTACLFIVLLVSMLLSRPDSGWVQYFIAANSGARTARLLLPAIVITPFLLSWAMVVAERVETFDAAFGFAVLAVVTTFVLGGILALASVWLSRSDAALARSNQSLLESERVARGIIDTALDAFVQIDESSRIIDWNPQAEAVFGWSRTEAIGEMLSRLILPCHLRKRHDEEIGRFLRTGKSKVLGKRREFDAVRKDGSEFKIELSVTALARRGGYVFNGFIRDLTEKLAVEAKLRQSQKMEAVGNLTGGIAHDFNNLLAVIVGNLDEMQILAKDNPELTELADASLSAALRGSDLTQRLLAFARKQPLQPQQVELNILLREHAKLLVRTLGAPIHIELHLADDTWPIIVDPAQLEAAILNLANNARDAMPDGGTISITTSNCHADEVCAKQVGDLTPGDYVVVEVRDSGTGMTPEIRNRVFEPFYTTKERGKGTGLGLAMVFGFVKQSNGHISVYSEPGVGTIFRLYFPRSNAAGKEVAQAVPTQASRGRNETVLVVEDNPDLRKLVTRQVESLGYRVMEAENASLALACFDHDRIELLFSDVVMPGGSDGVELARRVLARSPETRVVLTSGFADSRAWEQFGTLPDTVRFLKKPYRKDQLAETLRTALDGKARDTLDVA